MKVIDERALPRGDEKRQAVRSMFDAIAPRYDLINRIMTFRMDVRWRRKAADALCLARESRVVDLACGTGDFCRELARRGYAPVGVDLSYGMLAAARTSSPILQGDCLRLPFADQRVDGVTCGFALRNFVDLEAFFAELGRVVTPGGRIALLEVAEPPNALLRWGHGLYFGKVVPRIGGLLSDAGAYQYLPRSVEYLPEPDVMLDTLAAQGFVQIDRRLLSTGIAQLITATRSTSERPTISAPGEDSTRTPAPQTV